MDDLAANLSSIRACNEYQMVVSGNEMAKEFFWDTEDSAARESITCKDFCDQSLCLPVDFSTFVQPQ